MGEEEERGPLKISTVGLTKDHRLNAGAAPFCRCRWQHQWEFGKFGPVCEAVAWKRSKNDLEKQCLMKLCYYDREENTLEENMPKENMNEMAKRTVHLSLTEKLLDTFSSLAHPRNSCRSYYFSDMTFFFFSITSLQCKDGLWSASVENCNSIYGISEFREGRCSHLLKKRLLKSEEWPCKTETLSNN